MNNITSINDITLLQNPNEINIMNTESILIDNINNITLLQNSNENNIVNTESILIDNMTASSKQSLVGINESHDLDNMTDTEDSDIMSDSSMPSLVSDTEDSDIMTDSSMPSLVGINESHDLDNISCNSMPSLVSDTEDSDIMTDSSMPSLVSDTEYENVEENGLLLYDKTAERDTICKRIPICTLDGNITTVYERNKLQKENDNIKPYPYRLVMISSENNCQFCKDYIGRTYSYYVDIETHLGFISCSECRDKAKEAVNEWNDTVAYGRVKHMKNKIFKIYRTAIDPETGTNIEDGWELNSPIVFTINNDEYIECVNNKKNIFRQCKINDILELNNLSSMI